MKNAIIFKSIDQLMIMRLFRQLLWALKLDTIFLFKIRGIPVLHKVHFIVLKYIVYLRGMISGTDRRISHVIIFHKKFFYNNRHGLASLQRVYCESYRLKDIIEKNAVVIDVGAHTGQFHFFCRHYLNVSRVISIEPIRHCFEVLELNSPVPHECIHAAVSRKNELLTIYVPAASSQHSSSLKNESELYESSFRISARKLDEIIKECRLSRCHLLKIDTEGSEYDVLLSAQNSLNKIDLILVEMSVYRRSSGNLFTVGNFLQGSGFELLKLLPDTGDLAYLDGLFQRRK